MQIKSIHKISGAITYNIEYKGVNSYILIFRCDLQRQPAMVVTMAQLIIYEQMMTGIFNDFYQFREIRFIINTILRMIRFFDDLRYVIGLVLPSIRKTY